jgi:branched-chain amino acid transport system substrate-binding protein
VFPFLEREGAPLIFPLALNSAMCTPPRRCVFTVDPSYRTQPWIMVKHLVEAEQEDAPRLAILYQDDDYGRDGLEGLREAAAWYGLPIVGEESHRRGAVDFGTQVLNLRQADPTHVILFTVIRETASVLKEAHRLGWAPRFIGASPAGIDRVVELAGEAAAPFTAISVFVPRGNPPTDQLASYLDLVGQHDPERTHFIYHAYGFSAAQLLVEGLRRAGPELSRDTLINALEGLAGWSDWLLGAPVTYGPGVRGGGPTAAFMVKADTARQVMVRYTDWIHFEKPDAHADAR